MSKLYKRSEIGFALFWILLYVVLSGFADQVSENIGIVKSATAVLHVLLSFVLYNWITKNNLGTKYGLCKPKVPARKFLYYLPLVLVASTVLWNGAGVKYGVSGTLLFVVSMCAVGFFEEVLFRGLLFVAMKKEGVKSAIVVSSLTFGLGHIVNLFNGSGQEFGTTLAQCIFAVLVGFVLVLIFHYGGSLVPCILFHSINNALNVFAKESTAGPQFMMKFVLLIVVLCGYLFYLHRTFNRH